MQQEKLELWKLGQTPSGVSGRNFDGKESKHTPV